MVIMKKNTGAGHERESAEASEIKEKQLLRVSSGKQLLWEARSESGLSGRSARFAVRALEQSSGREVVFSGSEAGSRTALSVSSATGEHRASLARVLGDKLGVEAGKIKQALDEIEAGTSAAGSSRERPDSVLTKRNLDDWTPRLDWWESEIHLPGPIKESPSNGSALSKPSAASLGSRAGSPESPFSSKSEKRAKFLQYRQAANKAMGLVAVGQQVPEEIRTLIIEGSSYLMSKSNPKHQRIVEVCMGREDVKSGEGENRQARGRIYPAENSCACGGAHSQTFVDTNEDSGLCLLGAIAAQRPQLVTDLIVAVNRIMAVDPDTLVEAVVHYRRWGEWWRGDNSGVSDRQWNAAQAWAEWFVEAVSSGKDGNPLDPQRHCSIIEWRALCHVAKVIPHRLQVHQKADMRGENCSVHRIGRPTARNGRVDVTVHVYRDVVTNHMLGVRMREGQFIAEESFSEAVERIGEDPSKVLMFDEQDKIIESVLDDAISNLSTGFQTGQPGPWASLFTRPDVSQVDELRKEINASLLALVPPEERGLISVIAHAFAGRAYSARMALMSEVSAAAEQYLNPRRASNTLSWMGLVTWACGDGPTSITWLKRAVVTEYLQAKPEDSVLSNLLGAVRGLLPSRFHEMLPAPQMVVEAARPATITYTARWSVSRTALAALDKRLHPLWPRQSGHWLHVNSQPVLHLRRLLHSPHVGRWVNVLAWSLLGASATLGIWRLRRAVKSRQEALRAARVNRLVTSMPLGAFSRSLPVLADEQLVVRTTAPALFALCVGGLCYALQEMGQ